MEGITNPSEKYFKDGLWTFDGSVWRPQNQLLAFRDTVREAWSDTNAGVGTNTHNFTTVPAGQAWVVDSLLAFNATTAASFISIALVSGATSVSIAYTAYNAVTRLVELYPGIVLKAGEYIQAGFLNCVAGDDIYAHLAAHMFKVAE